MRENNLLTELRKSVLIKSGLRNIDPACCRVISGYIFKETKNYLSETTIKRFFGFANTLHKFSLFTLNSLSQYIGHDDWETFCWDRKNAPAPVWNIWQELKSNAHAITEASLIGMKNNSGVPFKATANRFFFYQDFDHFLKQSYRFSTISAQPGHGKSILLAHMVEYFFFSEDAIYKSDIVLLVNSSSISTAIQNGLSLKEWFLREFKFGSLAELIVFFKKNPGTREGRFIIIVDGIDEYLARNDYFQIFIDFLHGIEENNFVKLVFGLRTNSWINIQAAIDGSPSLTGSWYTGLFYDEDTLSNIPPLHVEEILYTLSHIENKAISIADINPALLVQFKTPFWLQIYFKLKEENLSLERSNPLLCYELISYFFEKRVFLAKKSTEKIFLLKKISVCISKVSENLTVSKEKILDYINLYPDTYEDLLHSGIIIEEKRLGTVMQTEFIRFLSEDIYTYFLFIQITGKFEYKLGRSFFEYILKEFPRKSPCGALLLNWSIRFCINRNEIAALKNIFRLPFTNCEKNNAFDFICYVYKFESARSNKLNIDVDFIDIMVTARTMNTLHKETIKAISEKALNKDIQIMLYVMQCSVNLIDIDKVLLANTLRLLKRNYKRLNELFPINPHDLILYFYNNLLNEPNESKPLAEKIMKFCREIERSHPRKNGEITSSEILCYRLVLITLFSQNRYTECHRFIMAILSRYPNIFYMRHSVFSPFLLLHLGQTYIKLSYLKKAGRIIQFVDKIISSGYSYYTNFTLSSFSIFKAAFYNATHNYKQSLIQANAGLKITRKNDFKIFEIALLLSKIDTLKHTGESEEVSKMIKELLNFLAVNNLSIQDYFNLSGSELEQTFKTLKSYHRHQHYIYTLCSD
jgi:hypothetical protein